MVRNTSVAVGPDTSMIATLSSESAPSSTAAGSWIVTGCGEPKKPLAGAVTSTSEAFGTLSGNTVIERVWVVVWPMSSVTVIESVSSTGPVRRVVRASVIVKACVLLSALGL